MIILRQSWEELLLIVVPTVFPRAGLLKSFVVTRENLLKSNVNVKQRKSLRKSVGGISEHFKMEMKLGTKEVFVLLSDKGKFNQSIPFLNVENPYKVQMGVDVVKNALNNSPHCPGRVVAEFLT